MLCPVAVKDDAGRKENKRSGNRNCDGRGAHGKSPRGLEGEEMNLLLDPKIFNYVIMVLYGLNVGRWAFAGSLKDVCYWLSALAITATVTFMYDH
jgi:hypothetical protein